MRDRTARPVFFNNKSRALASKLKGRRTSSRQRKRKFGLLRAARSSPPRYPDVLHPSVIALSARVTPRHALLRNQSDAELSSYLSAQTRKTHTPHHSPGAATLGGPPTERTMPTPSLTTPRTSGTADLHLGSRRRRPPSRKKHQQHQQHQHYPAAGRRASSCPRRGAARCPRQPP